ncbi:hypothetical protein [Chitinophaga sp. Cy-1792]|uniref:hypothetical protein n=1 Tax=Chitinophaga sp. Cy-1792 TaxID=2608339 RepID=UPI00141DA2B7|nr:hypothetical protein [Chitinophaga sp. Cy-1792]NIG57518.1 hypothetical protein [Chitinophaga sp. Cy-1792]
MKKVLFMCTLAFASIVGYSQTVENFNFRRVDKTTVPAVVVDAAERDYPDGSIQEYFAVPAQFTQEDWMISSDGSNNADYYSISIEKDGNTYYALYDKTGAKLASQVKMHDVPLPDKIVKAIGKKYKGYQIESDKYTQLVNESSRKSYYRVTIGNGTDQKKLFYNPDGSPAK